MSLLEQLKTGKLVATMGLSGFSGCGDTANTLSFHHLRVGVGRQEEETSSSEKRKHTHKQNNEINAIINTQSASEC